MTIATNECLAKQRMKSRFVRIRERITEALKGNGDLGISVRYVNTMFMIVDIGCMHMRARLTDIQINEIARITEVIKQEFPSRYRICSNPIGRDSRRIQMHIPLV